MRQCTIVGLQLGIDVHRSPVSQAEPNRTETQQTHTESEIEKADAAITTDNTHTVDRIWTRFNPIENYIIGKCDYGTDFCSTTHQIHSRTLPSNVFTCIFILHLVHLSLSLTLSLTVCVLVRFPTKNRFNDKNDRFERASWLWSGEGDQSEKRRENIQRSSDRESIPLQSNHCQCSQSKRITIKIHRRIAGFCSADDH